MKARVAAQVAPFAGAWIETVEVDGLVADAGESPPSRGRGLKLNEAAGSETIEDVAPFAGAWIETL